VEYISISSDSQETLKALKAAKTSPLVWHFQRALNENFTHHSVGLIWVPGHSGICGNEIADELAGESYVHQVVEPEPALGVSRQIKCWLTNQHIALWQGLTSTQTQTEQLVWGPNFAPKTRLFYFNRIQCRVVTGLAVHNILRRHLYMM
jgi:hypothetical protein